MVTFEFFDLPDGDASAFDGRGTAPITSCLMQR